MVFDRSTLRYSGASRLLLIVFDIMHTPSSGYMYLSVYDARSLQQITGPKKWIFIAELRYRYKTIKPIDIRSHL